MKNFKKNKFGTIPLILILTISVIIVALPNVNASTIMTYAFLGVVPNPTGVNQQVTLHVGITHPTAHPQEGWVGLTVIVKDPSGHTETIEDINTDTTGGTGITFVPTQIGLYTLQTHFPEQILEVDSRGTPAGTTMLASDSEIVTLTVQADPIEYYPGVELPTEYWTRPIDSQLREWSQISGNWLEQGTGLGGVVDKVSMALDNAAPESAHILWAKQLAIGGLVGGNKTYDEHGYYTGDAYEGLFNSPVILDGVLYFNRFETRHPTQDVVAVDLHTGEELWVMNWNNTRLSFGQILHWNDLNGHGSYAYLWANDGSTWNAYEPKYGTWVYGMTNVPSGSNYRGPNGEIYKYYIDDGRLLRWNSVYAMKWDDYTSVYSIYSWISGHSRLIGTTKDASNGYDLNVTVPRLPGDIVEVLDDKIIGSDIGDKQTTVWGLNLQSGHEGELLFNTTWNNPNSWIVGNQTLSWEAASSEVGVLWAMEVRQHYGVSFETGELLWGPTPSQNYRDQFYITGSSIAYGNLYASGIGGTLYCYDVTTGRLKWNYNATDTFAEFKISPNWWLYITFISDGKIYVGHYEHSSGDPKPRGAPFLCLNATNGELIWTIDGAFRQTMWGSPGIIGDSIIATMDTYDQRIYAIGRGPTAITVTASPKVTTYGSSVLIEGMLTDISPGTEDYAIRARFQDGVPAIADEFMSDWMLHVYKQFPVPYAALGVDILLEAFDSNGNYYEIGNVTSDASGMFKKMWNPPVEGAYTIAARFEGTNSYWGSYTETALGVSKAASPTTPIEREESVSTIISIVLVIISVLAIASFVVLAAYWVLRRRQ